MYPASIATSQSSVCSNSMNPVEKIEKFQNDKSTALFTTVFLVDKCAEDVELLEAVKTMGLKVMTSSVGFQLLGENDVAYVLEEFSGEMFKSLLEKHKPIFGPTAIKEFANANTALPCKKRPLYCQSMREIVICCSGFKSDVLEELVDLVHYMGGSVRKNYTGNVTHLVSATTQGEKYRLCVGAGIPIMTEEWVRIAWSRRAIVQAYAFSEQMKVHKLPAFFGLKLAFYGFSMDDTASMELRTIDLGAEVVEPPECSHYVINCQKSTEEFRLPSKPNEPCRMVSEEWFWNSIHMDICANEAEYSAFKKTTNGPCSPQPLVNPAILEASRTINGAMGGSRRSRPSLGTNGDGMNDTTALGDHMFSADDLDTMLLKTPPKSRSKREQICLELLQTEKNYVEVLQTIVKVFKEPLEKLDPFGKRLLKPAEIKMIFGNIADILAVHQKIYTQLENLILNWNEKVSIGPVWLDHKDELIKCYPPFVNFFETSKETLEACTQANARFQAFLKASQSKPECYRQSLKELLIRPVQRLPSVDLLLNDLLKHTERSHEDCGQLHDAIVGLKNVLQQLNEKKRKTEAQVKMFEILNAIENCPPYLLSSDRQVIAEVEVSDLSESFCKKKTSVLTLYLFNDCLEIAKNMQHGSRERTPSTRKTKMHKELVRLPQFRRVVNITNCSESNAFFCFTIRDNFRDNNHVFIFHGNGNRHETGADTSLNDKKREFLSKLCDQVVATTGRVGLTCEDHDAKVNADGCDLAITITKAIKRIQGESGTVSQRSIPMSPRNSSGSLKRVLSGVMIAGVGSLRRFASGSRMRTPLRGLAEEAEYMALQVTHDSFTNGE